MILCLDLQAPRQDPGGHQYKSKDMRISESPIMDFPILDLTLRELGLGWAVVGLET